MFNMDGYRKYLLQCKVLLQTLSKWDPGVQDGEFVTECTSGNSSSESELCKEGLEKFTSVTSIGLDSGHVNSIGLNSEHGAEDLDKCT